MSKNHKLKEHLSPPEVEFLCEKIKSMSPEVQFLGERSNRVVQASPEVQFIGERIFTNVCNDMATISDDLYNAGLSLGSGIVSTGNKGKENMPPKRVVRPSHFLTSPFENNSKIIIGTHEMKIYETLTTLCNDPQYQEWIIDMNNCKVSLNQLGNSMKQNGWVEAWVINACCRKLFKDNHPRKSNKHFFFHTSAEYFLEKWPSEYMKNIWNKNVIKNFHAADSTKKLHLSERLNFPALYDDHWFVFAVDIKTQNFLFLYSLYGERSSLHQRVDDMLITNFLKTWNECDLKDMHFEKYGKVFPSLPKQKTRNDRGVFTIKYMQKYSQGTLSPVPFQQVTYPNPVLGLQLIHYTMTTTLRLKKWIS
uniref:Uncharacterized protein n=1 Tax=Avena sativa TaxID=4498 RepID=A0ACD6A236_AVESA